MRKILLAVFFSTLSIVSQAATPLISTVPISQGMILLNVNNGNVSFCSNSLSLSKINSNSYLASGSCIHLCSVGTSGNGYELTASGTSTSAFVVNNSSGEIMQVVGNIDTVDMIDSTAASCKVIGNTSNM
jgi:hypothetical protein